ncbi:hypothetical protein GCM10027408_14220 [Microbacterium tumbae]
MRDIVDAVDGAGREFKQGFAGAFRKRGGRHRADADAIRGLDRRGAAQTPRHRAERRPASHAKDYSILEDVSRGIDALGRTPRHSNPDYNLVRDLGGAVGQGVRDIPKDLLGEVKGIPKKIAEQLVDELFENAIGQSSPTAYGEKPGDMRFLAPAGEAGELRALDGAGIESRFDLEPGALDGAKVEVEPIPETRFVSVEIDVPGE